MSAGRLPTWLRIAGGVLSAALLAGCGTPAKTEKPRFNLSGYSASFRQGHADGCASAGGRQRRDEKLFRDNADYMMGWNDGRSACKN